MSYERLRAAIRSLESALRVFEASASYADMDDDLVHVVQAGLIQNFEFTYELCWKMMKRWLEENVSPRIVTGVTRRHLFRFAAENRLIHDVEVWIDYHRARNLVAHTYDKKIADELSSMCPEFARDARRLLEALEQK